MRTEVEKAGRDKAQKTLYPVWSRLFSSSFILTGIFLFLIPKENVADYFRAASFGLSVELLILIVIILYVYNKISREYNDGYQNFPLHILSVGVSYILLVLAEMAFVITKLGEPVSIFGVVTFLPAVILGIIAMGFMWRYQIIKEHKYERERNAN